jgi:hypothetical protein
MSPFLVIVVLDLHDLVADGKGRPEFLDLWFFAWIESPLQLDIQRTGAKPAAVYRAEHLDVAHPIEAEPAGDALLDEFDEPPDGNIRLRSRDFGGTLAVVSADVTLRRAVIPFEDSRPAYPDRQT